MMKNIRKQKLQLKEKVWEKSNYYKSARELHLSGFHKNLGMLKLKAKLKEKVKEKRRVLDCGSGDGTVIELIDNTSSLLIGYELSNTACRIARRRFLKNKNILLVQGDIEKLGIGSGKVDLVYSVYTLEHLCFPEKALKEMVRVLAINGELVIICPNYGSPFFPSPCTEGNLVLLLKRAGLVFIKSLLLIARSKEKSLGWERVVPKVFGSKQWDSDWDATVEPYIQTLLQFLKYQGVKIYEFSSGFDEEKAVGDNSQELAVFPLKYKLLRYIRNFCQKLGSYGLKPFCYFGPAIYIYGRKIG